MLPVQDDIEITDHSVYQLIISRTLLMLGQGSFSFVKATSKRAMSICTAGHFKKHQVNGQGGNCL